jgi:hypothetical protein
VDACSFPSISSRLVQSLHEKAKKKNVEFANELKALATKMEKKLDKIDQAYQQLAKLWDPVTKGGFSGSQKAVNSLFAELSM